MQHSIKEWINATRHWSFPVSIMPVLVTAAYLSCTNGFAAIHWLYVILALIGAVLLHAAGNLLSDVGDFRSGADSEEAFAVPNLVKHIFTEKEYLTFSAILFAVGAAIGLVLTWLCGMTLLPIGIIGILLTLLYTKSKNVFLSDATIFVVFGILIILGTTFVAVGTLQLDVLILSIPVGLITLSVLHANNTVDINTDKAVGIHTIAMAMGENAAVKCYVAYQIIPFVFVVGAVLAKALPYPTLICLIAIIPATANIKKALAFYKQGREALFGLDISSAKLQLAFSLSLTIGLFISALL